MRETKTEKRMLTKAYLQRSIQDPLNVHQQVREQIRQQKQERTTSDQADS